jgi:hypothetical protein
MTSRLLTDHLGSVRLIVAVGTGAIAQRLDFGESGRISLDTTPGVRRFGFGRGALRPQGRRKTLRRSRLDKAQPPG